MHQVSLETICPLKAFQLHYCPDNDAKSMVKHLIFLQKFAVLTKVRLLQMKFVDPFAPDIAGCFTHLLTAYQYMTENF